MTKGSFTFVLHSHMPYVLAHGASPHGTDWLCEATAECYLPLLDLCRRLIADGVSPRLTLGLTPVLVEQLCDPRFPGIFRAYLDGRREQADIDAGEFARKGDERAAELARSWADWHCDAWRQFSERWSSDLVAAFSALQDAGHIEIVGGSATHGYSPLFSRDETIAAQVRIGARAYRRRFGRAMRGYWLPECGYRPRTDSRRGIEEFLAAEGVEYFFAESDFAGLSSGALAGGSGQATPHARPAEGGEPLSPYRPHSINSTGAPMHPVHAFLRDPATGTMVWSAEIGYPGDPWYLDFHRRNSPDGAPVPGLRYWQVSGGAEKSLYEPGRALERAAAHARHFASVVEETLAREAPEGKGIVCSVYDTELFGHWWFEGPRFLEAAIRALAARPGLSRVTCGSYLSAAPISDAPSMLREGSWGAEGGHGVWLNPRTQWIWDGIHASEATMARLAEAYSREPRVARLLAQAARELLLLTASDWPFLVTMGSASDYAHIRFADHLRHFEILAGLIDRAAAGDGPSISQWKSLADAEQRDRLFADIDVSAFLP